MIIDCHNHCWSESSDRLVEALDRFGIDQACCSCPVVDAHPTAEKLRQNNDIILAAMRRYPKRILGQCFVTPGLPRESQDEITRCVADGGMIGIKLYNQYRINDPVQFPIIERCIDLGVSILMHAAHPGYTELLTEQPNISTGDHFLDVARRYPEALLICAHIAGGGEWERQLKPLRDAPSVFLDTGGSVPDAGMIDKCVRELGVQRLLFATDGLYEPALARIREAHLTAKERRMILADNFRAILARRRG